LIGIGLLSITKENEIVRRGAGQKTYVAEDV